MDKSTRLCIIEPLEQDTTTIAAARKLRVPLVFSSCGTEYVEDAAFITYFVVAEFQGPVYDMLCHQRARIIGPTAVIHLAGKDGKLSQLDVRRPLYSLSMKDCDVCFTGYRNDIDHMNHVSRLIRHMGGKVRREMHQETNHLIAHHPGGEKYDYADTFNIPIVSDSWVLAAWERRRDPAFDPTDRNVECEHKLKLGGTKIGFQGFSPECTEKYKKFVQDFKGQVCDPSDPLCTHLVVNDSEDSTIPENVPPGCKVVKSEWFWKSIERECCLSVKPFLLCETGEMTPDGRMHTPGSASSRARKRKRLQQIARSSGSPITGKRRSSAHTLDYSGNFLDWTLTPDKTEGGENKKDSKAGTVRKLKYHELVNTETNYVEILKVIVKSFKTPLDEAIEKGNPILDVRDIRTIFGNIPPILEAHSSMLENLKAGIQSWSSSFVIGQIILDKADDFQRAYPPFINYFEQIKETLEQCETNNPRFHAFLKIRQSQPECGRQTLKELMIRPVQRLPSVSLLLSDLLKHTDKDHPDHSKIELALAAIKKVMTYINEDKRRTEAQRAMFALFNDIENCPADLISSHRSLVDVCDCHELIEGRKGDPVTLLLFTDTLGMCVKRRAKPFTIRGTKGLSKLSKTKQYKNLKLVPLSHIRRVLDVRESPEWSNSFTLVVYNSDTMQDVLYNLSVTDENKSKATFLKTLCQQLACALCTTDPDEFLEEVDKVDVGLDTTISKSSTHSLTKFASIAKVKMGRALSLSRTPSRASRIMPRRGIDGTAPSPALSRMASINLNSSSISLDTSFFGV